MLSSAFCPPAIANRSENHFVRIRGVFGESSHSDFLIHSLSISECSQNSVDGRTLDVGEIVFFAQLDFDRFVFHVLVGLKTIFTS
jgi:hypothetical protein